MQSMGELLQPIDLRGVKVWLSGAIPEAFVDDPETKRRVEVWNGMSAQDGILGFVRTFSAMVFKYGGSIVHGSHPTFTHVLIAQAKRFQESAEKSPLTLVVSDHFKEGNEDDWKKWRATSHVVRTEATGFEEKDRDPSLQILRSTMADTCNSFVAIGGKWWHEVPGRAGVPIEFKLAKERSVPCFVLGGFGGASSQYALENPDWYGGLNNGLDPEDNRMIATLTDFSLAAGLIVSQLHRVVKIRA